MNKRKLATGIAAGIITAALPIASTGGTGNLLEQAFSRAWKNARSVDYAPPSVEEVKATQQLFKRLLQGEKAGRLRDEFAALGWKLSQGTAGGATWTIVAEEDSGRTGRGLYAFSNGGRHALQAPHVPSDTMTGDILLRYAEDGLPRALAWNTVPRRSADLAHLERSYLIAFSRAFAEVYPAETIFQFHGFDAWKRRSFDGAQSSAIVSPGHRHAGPELQSAVKCMQKHVDARSRLYGSDVHELGGVTNSVARALQRDGHDLFVHVEMDLPLRARLAGDPALRRDFLACYGGKQ